MLLNSVGCLAVVLYAAFAIRRARKVIDPFPEVNGMLAAIALVAGSVILVNTVAPGRKDHVILIAADTLSAREADTTLQNLQTANSRFHYQLVQKLITFKKYDARLRATQSGYQRCTEDRNPSVRNVGWYGLALISSLNDDHTTAYDCIRNISTADYPFVNFLKGEMMLEQDRYPEAEYAFRQELNVPGGNFRDSYLRLVDIYERRNDYRELCNLLHLDTGDNLIPGYLARRALLSRHEWFEYPKWILRGVNDGIQGYGLIAAIVIFIVWFGCHSFIIVRHASTRMFLAIAFCGGAGVFAIVAVNDCLDLIAGWERNGEVVNDLAYCIAMVGAPEEIVKFLPLFFLLLVRPPEKPSTWIWCGSASALGFSFVENLMYFRETSEGIIHGRAFLAAVGHMADISFAVYGIVYCRFFNDGRYPKSLIMLAAFASAVVSHGVYDFLLYHKLTALFFVFFSAVCILWARIIYVCATDAHTMTTSRHVRMQQGEMYLVIALTLVLTGEYVINGFLQNRDAANRLLTNNAIAFFYIVFYPFILFRWRRMKIIPARAAVISFDTAHQGVNAGVVERRHSFADQDRVAEPAFYHK
jgi:RsiW-degrading membrane proteinase PrsW (M82 family)